MKSLLERFRGLCYVSDIRPLPSSQLSNLIYGHRAIPARLSLATFSLSTVM